jgi:ParB family transcriptional regulator, chromosome partitioning protein
VAKPKRGGLGRGLDALISRQPSATADPAPIPEITPTGPPAPAGTQLLELDPHALRPNPKQPRTVFKEESLEELAESIKRDGVQEPIIVRRKGEEYELVSGERRVRATIMAGLEVIPAICREVSDSDMLKLGLIENIQREDLNPMELAAAYQELVDEFTWTQEQLAAEVGKKRATVANMLRLLNLPADVQRSLADGEISMGHARALLALETAAAQSNACRKIIAGGLSVRQAEKLAQPKAKPVSKAKDPNIAHIEDDLRRTLGTRVSLRAGSKGRGKIEIEYFNLDDLERLLDLLRSTK